MTRLPNGDWSYKEAVDSLCDIHMGTGRGRPTPPRVLPPRPLPRHLIDPAPRRPWGTDLAAVTRRRRVLDALTRMRRIA